jgi:hypothetical protein
MHTYGGCEKHMHNSQINAQGNLNYIMHGKSIQIPNWKQHDDISLGIPHVETNLIDTTWNG